MQNYINYNENIYKNYLDIDYGYEFELVISIYCDYGALTDDERNDIIPAQKLGMITVWIKQGYGRLGNIAILKAKPNYIIGNVKELLDIDFCRK